MKNLITTITVLLFTLSICAGESTRIIKPQKAEPCLKELSFLANYLSIKKIKDNIKNGKEYITSQTVNIIKNSAPGHYKTVFSYSFNCSVLSKENNNYIQANSAGLRRYNTSHIDKFRVYIHHDSQGKVDLRNVKVNWTQGSEFREVVAKLSNVKVINHEDSILIMGSMKQKGYSIAVTIAIVEVQGLI